MAKKSIKKKKETELQRAFKWINSLSGERAEFIREFARHQSKKDVDKAVSAIDRCTSAAIVNVLDVDWKVIEEIQDNLTHYLAEDIEKMNENRIRYGGLDMASKKINEQEKLVKERVNELIYEGVKQKEMVKTLSVEFPMLSKAMITNSIKRVKSQRLEDTEEAAKYILGENEKLKEEIQEEIKEEAKRVAEEVARQLEKEEHITEVSQKIEEVKEEKVMSKLKIKKVELEGEFGSYVREGNKVIAGEIVFNNLEELEEYQRKEIEIFNRRMEEIREVYKIG